MLDQETADETADTATETVMDEMEDTEAAHAKTIHEKGSMRAMATKRILAKFADTKGLRGIMVCLAVGFSIPNLSSLHHQG